jgi:TonB-linked SusC/RagA family outer membrane protein
MQLITILRFRNCRAGSITHKSLRVIKLTLVLLLASCLLPAARAAGQIVTVNVKNAPMKEVFREIQKQTGLNILIDEAILEKTGKITLDVKDMPVRELVNLCIKNEPLSYSIADGRIVVKPKQNLALQPGDPSPPPPPPIVISGKITGAEGEALSGASVKLKGTAFGTTTDSAGNFTMQIPNTGSVLVISHVGYETVEIPVLRAGSLRIELKQKQTKQEEVVVIGYGTQKLADLTGAVAVVKGDALVNRATTTVSQSLQGKVSGVFFTPGANGFEPGSALSLQIRGQGNPLVLIDGVPGTLDGLNPNDVESISILKDAASSAIYGAKAPYGVVLVTTKSGSKDGKINIEYSHSTSGTRLVREPHMVNSYTNALALNEACDNTGTQRLFTDVTIDRIQAYQKNPSLPQTVPSAANPTVWAVNNESNANFDWFNVYYGQGNRSQDNISFQGGSQKLSYYLAAAQQHDGGVLRQGKDDYQRYNIIAKFDMNPLKWLSFSTNTRYINTTRIRPSATEEGGYSGLFWYVARNYPNQYITDPNGHTSRISWIPFVRDGGAETIKSNEVVQRFAARVTPMKGLSIDADYSIDLISTLDNLVSNTLYDYGVQNQPIIMSQSVPNYLNESQSLYFYNTLNVYATYKFNLEDKHHFSILAGSQLEQSTSNYLFGTRNNLIDQDIPSLSLATGVQQTTDTTGRYATEGIFSRINYDYDNKYLLQINSRYDGTYKFAADKRWGFFPSVSAGWNMSSEKFWEPIRSVVNSSKIRASYGALGNQLNAAPYQDLALMGVSSNLPWIINGARPAYVTAPNLVNTAITWETSATQDLGTDLGFLQNKLTFTGDIYKRYTYNQLGPSNAVPAVIGVAVLPNSNNMETVTKGWETSLTWHDRIGKDFNYTITGMVFDYLTKITKYNNPTKILTNPYAGETEGEIWGFVTKGLIQNQKDADAINSNGTQKAISGIPYNTGDCEYKDLNGDGLITYGNNTVTNPGDRKVIGNSTPRYQFGLNLKVEWKGFAFAMFWQGVAKDELMLNGNMMWGFQQIYANTLTKATLNYYRDATATQYSGLGVNLNSYYPRPYNDASMNAKNQITQTRYLQNGGYARLKNVQLGYTIPKGLTDKVKLQDMYLYVSGENLLTFTHLLPQFDPESANIGNSSAYSYPPQGILTVGVNVKF